MQSESEVRKVINGLLTRGILHASPTKPILYTPTTPYPDDPTKLSSLSQFYQVSEGPIENKIKTVSPKIDSALVSNMIESYLYAKVEDIDLVYYPYYEIWFENPDGSNRVEILDGTTGALSEKIAT